MSYSRSKMDFHILFTFIQFYQFIRDCTQLQYSISFQSQRIRPIIKMQDNSQTRIELVTNLITEILYNEHFRLLLRQTVDEMCKKTISNTINDDEVQSMSEITSEVVQYLLAYMNQSILKMNSEYSENLLKRFEQMHKQQQSKLQKKIQNRIEEIISQFIEKIEKVSHSSRHLEETSRRIDAVSEKRKALTQNILNYSIVQQHKENKANDDLENSLSGFQGLLDHQFSNFATKKLDELTTRMTEIELGIKETKKQLEKKLQRTVELTDNMNSMLSEQISLIRENVNDQFHANLEGVWNVIAELQKKILQLKT